MAKFEGPDQQSDILETREPQLNINGQLIYNGAPYSAIGMEEIHLIAPSLIPTWNFNPVPESISARPFSQYKVGADASPHHQSLG